MRTLASFGLLISASLAFTSADAVLVDGIDFDDSWFADAVVDYSPPQGAIIAPSGNDSMQVLGPPDIDTSSGFACFSNPNPQNCRFTSLGDGGSLTVQFIDNFVNGDGTPANDLYLIEVGEAEGATVQISETGATGSFVDVGIIPVNPNLGIGIFTYGFDIDAVGFGINRNANFVRVIDSGAGITSNPQGSDFDAIGGIFTIPLPAVAWLFPAGLLSGLGWMRRQAH